MCRQIPSTVVQMKNIFKRTHWSRPTLAVAIVIISLANPGAFAQETVDPRSGQLQLEVTDLVVAAGPLNLDITRIFHSGNALAGVLGPGWHLSLESSVHGSSPKAVVFDGGRAMVFRSEDGGEMLHGPSGERLSFEDGQNAIRSGPGGVTSVYEVHDGVGRLAKLTYPNGNTIQLSYSEGGTLERIEGPKGSFLDFVADERGRVTGIQSSQGTSVQYSHIGDRLSEVRVNGGPPHRYLYDEVGELIAIVRPITGWVDLTYDEDGRVTRRRWPNGDAETYEYEGLSQSTRLNHANGGSTLYAWSDDGRVEEITDPLGNTTRTEFNAEFRPTVITDPSGAVTRYSYDALGRVVEVDDGQSGVTKYEYQVDSALETAIHRADGIVETFEYDEQGNLLIEAVDGTAVRRFTYFPDGLVESVKGIGVPELRFSYLPNGLLHTQTDAMEQVTRYQYDDHGNLVALTNAAGNTTRWEFDELDRTVRETDAAGGSTVYSYDDRGLLVTSTDPTRAVTRFDYDGMGRLIAEIDPAGRTTRYSYGSGGQLTSVVDAGGHIAQLEYDTVGRLIREVNPLGGETRYDYTNSDRITKMFDPSGGRWMFEYSPDGTTSTVDPAGNVIGSRYDPDTKRETGTAPQGFSTWRDYDALGRIVRTGESDGVTHELGYDDRGNLVAISDPRGTILTAEVDQLGRTVLARTGTGFEVHYRYDENGNLVASEDSTGPVTTMTYDEVDRLTRWIDATGGTTRYAYDPAGRPLRLTDPAGQVTRLEYNPAGDLVRVHGPTGAVVALEYDRGGGISALHSPTGGVYRVSSDAMGNPVQVKDPLGGETINLYDTAGRLIKHTGADGRTSLFSYDVAGRLVRRTLSDGRIVSYTFDPSGNPVTVDDGTFPIHYTYDTAGRLTSIEYPAIRKSIGYRYDDDGRLAEFVDWQGRRYRYAFDRFERLETVTIPGGGVFSFSYDSQDRPVAMIYPNGVRKTTEYDIAGRVASISVVNRTGAPIMGWSYTYDAAAKLTRVRDIRGRETNYSYDGAGRLTEETGPAGTFRYGYSPGGNRISFSDGERSTQYRYNAADQLISAGDETFAYDRRGNLVERRGPAGVTHYVFDADNRLLGLTLPDGAVVRYGYAPTGERIWREDSSGRTWFITDGRNLLAELDEALDEANSYWHGPGLDNPLVMWRGGEQLFYHTDMMGSVAALTSLKGDVEATYLTDAFGSVRTSTGSTESPFVFTARELDPATGLYDFRARVYDPRLGRFLSPDSIRRSPLDPEGFSRYAYARNTPTRYSDPTGLDLWDFINAQDPFKVELGPDADPYHALRPARALEAKGPDPMLDRHIPATGGGSGHWEIPRTPAFIKAVKPKSLQLTDRRWLALCEREYRVFAQKNPVLSRVWPETSKRMAMESLAQKINHAPVGASPRQVVRYIRLRQQGVLKGPESYPAHWSSDQVKSAMEQAARNKMGLGPPPHGRRPPSVGSKTPTRTDLRVDELGPRARSGSNTVAIEAQGSGGAAAAQGAGGAAASGYGSTGTAQAPKWNPNYRPKPLSTTRGPWAPITPKVPTAWQRFTKPPTAGQTGMLTILLTAEMIARCRTRGLTAGECAEEAIPGFLILAGTAIVCIKAPAIGVVVVVAGTALAIHKGVTDVIEGAYEGMDYWNAVENRDRILEDRKKWTEENIKNEEKKKRLLLLERKIRDTADQLREACAQLANIADVMTRGAKSVEAELAKKPSAGTINAGADACRTLPDKGARLRAIQGDIDALIDKTKGEVDTARSLAEACRTKQDAVKLKALIQANDAALQKIEKTAAEAKKIQGELDRDRVTINKAQNALRKAMALRDLLIDAANSIPPIAATEAEVRRAEAAIDLLTDPSPSLGNDIKNLIKAFGDYDTLSLEMISDINGLRQLVRDSQSLVAQCKPADFLTRHRDAANKVVTAKLNAQALIDQVDAAPLADCDVDSLRSLAEAIQKSTEGTAGLRSVNDEAKNKAKGCLAEHGLSVTDSGGGAGSGSSSGSSDEPPPLVEASSGGSGGGGGGGGKPPLVDASKTGGPTTGGDPGKPSGVGGSKAGKAQPGDEELVYANLDIELAQDDYGIYDILDNFRDSEIIIKNPQGEKQYLGADAIRYLASKGWIFHKNGVGWVATDRLKRFLGIGEPDEPEKKKDSGRPTLGGMTFDGPLENYNPDDPNTPEGKRKILRDRLSKLSRECNNTPESSEYWSCWRSCSNLLFSEYGKISQDRVDKCENDCDAVFDQKKPQVCREAEAVAAQLEKLK